MLSLQDRNWMPFFMIDLFERFEGGKGKGRNHLVETDDGGIPYIGATNRNNGVLCFVQPDDYSESLKQEGNCIGFIRNGDGSAGYAIYKSSSFVSTSDVMYGYASWLNRWTGLFFVTAQNQIKSKYSHGHKRSPERLKRDKVMLPVDMLGEPDWKFMENYIREREAAHAQRCREFLIKRIADIERERERVDDTVGYLTSLAEKTWRSYRLSSIGDVQSGRDIYASDRMKGNTPYITSGSQNNGIGYFVANSNDTLDSGYIALNRNGAVGMAFYHPYPSLMGNDCRKLHVKAADGNPYVGNFIALAISKQSECFSYSRKLGTTRARALRIMLPAADDGQPDYAYMEGYGRELTLHILCRQLSFIES